jgi:hypothetical protein
MQAHVHVKHAYLVSADLFEHEGVGAFGEDVLFVHDVPLLVARNDLRFGHCFQRAHLKRRDGDVE